jgi:predicted nucleotidyltransferase
MPVKTRTEWQQTKLGPNNILAYEYLHVIHKGIFILCAIGYQSKRFIIPLHGLSQYASATAIRQALVEISKLIKSLQPHACSLPGNPPTGNIPWASRPCKAAH